MVVRMSTSATAGEQVPLLMDDGSIPQDFSLLLAPKAANRRRSSASGEAAAAAGGEPGHAGHAAAERVTFGGARGGGTPSAERTRRASLT